MGEVSRSRLILKMDLLGFADGSDVDVRCLVDGEDGAALISDAGLRDGGAQHGHVVCEIPRSPPCGGIEGQLTLSLELRAGPGWRQGCGSLGHRRGSSPDSGQGRLGGMVKEEI